MEWSAQIQTFVGILAIVNPFGVVPVYLVMTQEMDRERRHRALGSTAIALLTVLLSALLIGNALLHFFGVTIPTFRIAGGLLILSAAFAMLRGRSIEEPGDDPSLCGVVPLGIPLLAGPGAISTVVVLSREHPGVLSTILLALTILLVTACVYVALRFAPLLTRLIGPRGLQVMSRVMGLFLAAMALEFVAAGLRDLFPGLMG